MNTSLKRFSVISALLVTGLGINASMAQGTKTVPAPKTTAPKIESATVLDQTVVSPLGVVSDNDINALEVSAVQPVIFMDPSDANEASVHLAGVQSLKEDAEDAKALDAQFDLFTMPAVTTKSTDGLGFEGNSRKLDVVSIKYGLMLGSMPMVGAKAGKRYDKFVAKVKKWSALNQYYTTNTQMRLKAYLVNAEKRSFNSKEYIELMRTAAMAMVSAPTTDKQRVHAYLVVGLWSGYAQMLSVLGKKSNGMSQIGDALRMMLTKDAKHGSSDLALASQVKVIAGQLKTTPNKASVQKAVRSILETKADN